MKIVRDDKVPAFLGAKKMSLHQTGFQEVIATAMLVGRCPERLLLIGVQPVELEDYGGGLRPAVEAQIPVAIDVALAELRDAFGVTATPRAPTPVAKPDPLSRAVYEGQRPEPEVACRIGDDRFMPAPGTR